MSRNISSGRMSTGSRDRLPASAGVVVGVGSRSDSFADDLGGVSCLSSGSSFRVSDRGSWERVKPSRVLWSISCGCSSVSVVRGWSRCVFGSRCYGLGWCPVGGLFVFACGLLFSLLWRFFGVGGMWYRVGGVRGLWGVCVRLWGVVLAWCGVWFLFPVSVLPGCTVVYSE